MEELSSGEGGGGGDYGILQYSLVGSYVKSSRFFLNPALSHKCINTTIISRTR